MERNLDFTAALQSELRAFQICPSLLLESRSSMVGALQLNSGQGSCISCELFQGMVHQARWINFLTGVGLILEKVGSSLLDLYNRW